MSKHTTQYLYGDLGEPFKDMQRELAEHKIYCCRRELMDIVEDDVEHRDVDRYRAIKQALAFNEMLLKELEDE